MSNPTGMKYLRKLLEDAERRRDECQEVIDAYKRVLANIERLEREAGKVKREDNT